MKCAKDIMTTDVIYLTPEDSILDAARFFAELNIHGVAVLDGKKLVGMLTVSDIIRFIDFKVKGPLDLPVPPGLSTTILSLVATLVEGKRFDKHVSELAGMKVKGFMSTKPVTIRKSTNILEIARIMHEKKFHRLPVTSRGKLVGMVTGSDLMEMLIMDKGKKLKKPKD